MPNEAKIVPLEPGNRLSVRCYIQGIQQGKWDRLSAEYRLPRTELEEIGNLFFERQMNHNAWRWHKSEQFQAAGQQELAEAWRLQVCMLCNERMYVQTGGALCACYQNYGIGFTQYEVPDPIHHLAAWENLGGRWSQDKRPTEGTKEARTYANKLCYSDDCKFCKRPFQVMISELLKIGKLIKDGGDAEFHLRRMCVSCKNERRNWHAQHTRQNKVTQLRPEQASVAPGKKG